MKNTILPAGIAASVLALAMSANQAHANNTFGLDVSTSEGTINWTEVKSNGAEFAFVEATTGFTNTVTAAKAAGLQVGAVYFVHPEADCPSTDANAFWKIASSTILNDGKTISPAEDVETMGNDCEPNITAWVNAWATDVQAKTSLTLHVIVYCSASYACNFIEYDQSGGIKPSPWIANYNGENLYTGNPWAAEDCCNAWTTGCSTANWKFWQVTDTGAIGGISGDCDFDAYNGTLANLISSFGVK